jgi:hypothetical protein
MEAEEEMVLRGSDRRLKKTEGRVASRFVLLIEYYAGEHTKK